MEGELHYLKLDFHILILYKEFFRPITLFYFYFHYSLGFDANQVFYSDNFGADGGGADEGNVTNLAAKKRFKDFLRQFHEEGNNLSYKYRDNLRRNYALRQFWINVNLEDLASFDESLADKLYKAPTDFLPLFEEAATEVADEVTSPRPEGEDGKFIKKFPNVIENFI